MKIALCLHGLVGNLVDKSGNSKEGVDKVIELSYKHYNDFILKHNDVDIFIHSWNIDEYKKIDKLFKPKHSYYEKQIYFDIPSFIPGDENRKNNHFSKWYSVYQSNKYKREYEQEKGFKYDFVINARFDIAWKKPIIFSEFAKQSDNIFCGGWKKNSNRKVKDFFFFSNSEYMDDFCNLFFKIEEYCKIGNEKIYNSKLGISNHRLAAFHLKQLNLPIKYILRCEEDDSGTLSDYPLIRYAYADNHKKIIHKPWGSEELIEHNLDYVCKKLFMKKDACCSLQYHVKKHETVCVLSGKLLLKIGESKESLIDIILNPGDTYVIPPSLIHRMIGLEDTYYLEASTPELSDVVRLEDKYGR